MLMSNYCSDGFDTAMCPQVYLKEGRILPWAEVSWLSCEEYLGGLMDFTGA